jgi:hypothetical protein
MRQSLAAGNVKRRGAARPFVPTWSVGIRTDERIRAARAGGSGKKSELFEGQHAAAEHANHTSDTYVLLTVLFASVMFFGGICGTFDSYRLRVITLGISIALLSFTLIALATMPVCWE